MGNFENLLILMVVVWVAGKIFRALKLPVIFGELIGGIIVGPMILGLIEPNNEMVKILAELGVFFLMFHSGLETDPKNLFKKSKKFIPVALGSAFLPMIAGYFVGQAFGRSFEESLLIAVVFSVTAIAVSVRIFKDSKIKNGEVADIVLGAAVINDVLALILLSVVLNIHETGTLELLHLLLLVGKTVLFFAVVMLLGCKASKYIPKALQKKGFTLALIAALSIGLIAEAIGLHIIIGAFLAGLFIRQEVVDEKIFNKIEDRIYGLSYSFLGPIFFASLAFYIDFAAIKTAPVLLISLIVAAVLSKTLGAGLAAFTQISDAKKSAVIGLAMNSRGAVELVIASIALNKGIIDIELFSILIVMTFSITLIPIFLMKPLAKYA